MLDIFFDVTKRLPDNRQKVLCFGHKTYCCSDDMDENPDWHEVIFEFVISSYRIKKEIPKNPEESMLEEYTMCEQWNSVDLDEQRYHIIGVKKWKNI